MARRAGPAEGQSAFRIQRPSGCRREGPAGQPPQRHHLQAPQPLENGRFAVGSRGAGRPGRAPYLLYRPPGPPAAAAPASRLCLMKKQTVTPKLHRGLLFPHRLSGSAQPGPPRPALQKRKGSFIPEGGNSLSPGEIV